MKYKLFWLAIPLALVLSSLDHFSKVDATTNNTYISKNTFIEDTNLHEELFNHINELKIRKTFSPIENSGPSIGIQTNLDNHGTVNEDDDTISVRFVAAVTINGDLNSATAVWTRAMFDTNGHAFKETANKACTTAYTSLATAGSPYTIEDYNNACGGSYTHFVAYTMRNIPLNDYSNYYFTAYLTLNDNSGETVSKVIATTVDLNTQFSFETSDTGYFMIKSTNSGFASTPKDTFDDGGNYHAQFEGVEFDANDKFIIVNRELNHFQVFGYNDAHTFDPTDAEFIQSDSSDFLRAKYDRNYFVFLDDNNRLSFKEAFAKTFYFKPNTNWTDGNSKYVMTLKHEEENNARVYQMNRIGETNTYQCDCFYTASMLNTAPISFYKVPLSENIDLINNPHSQKLGWPLNNDDMFTMNIGNNKGYWSLRT